MGQILTWLSHIVPPLHPSTELSSGHSLGALLGREAHTQSAVKVCFRLINCSDAVLSPQITSN